MTEISLKDYWISQSGYSRVTYERNTLSEVIFQARFGRILKIDAELPVEFQKAVRATHPLLEVEEGFEINLAAQGSTATPTKTYKFFSEDQKDYISLNSSFIAFTTPRYTRWEDFRSNCERAVLALLSVYDPNTLLRIGLRYLNVIDRDGLGVPTYPWNRLLKPVALGWMADEECEKRSSHCQTEILYSCNKVRSRVRSGLVRIEGSPPPVAFLLDADYYIESRSDGDVAKILDQLDELNSYSGPFFRWCITEELHALLGPH